MKKIVYLVTLIVSLGAMLSCTQNNGYIGPLFGQWQLKKITTDAQVEVCDTVFWAFQSDVFQIRKVNYESYVSMSYTGLYRRPDNNLQLHIYNYWGNEILTTNDTINTLKTLEHLYIDELSPIFVVEQLDNSNMVLEYKGHKYHYKKLN